MNATQPSYTHNTDTRRYSTRQTVVGTVGMERARTPARSQSPMAEIRPLRPSLEVAPEPATSEPARRRRRAPIIAAVLALAAAAGSGYVYISRRGNETTDDARVEGHVSNIAARVSGQVVRILVRDNQVVKPGDLLVELDDRDHRVRLSAARAELAAAEASQRAAETQLALAKKQAAANLVIAEGGVEQADAATSSTSAMIRQARADLAMASSQRTLSRRELARTKKLFEAGAITQSELDARRAAAEQASAAVHQARARLASAKANRSSSDGTFTSARGRLLVAETGPEQIASAQAQVELAGARVSQLRAGVEQAELALSYTQVRAGVGGMITKRSVEAGQLVSPERPLMAIVDLSDTWIVANFKETQLAEMRPGQPAEIVVDAFDHVTLHGQVESIAAGTGSRFSLLPPDNASGNFTRVTQRVPVWIRIADDRALVLRPGMSAEVTVHVD